MVDVIQGIGILALAVAVFCQVKINRELMRQIDLLHDRGSS
jgi:hypothetical protein